MRRWHRWLSVFFAIVMIWVAITGLLHYVVVWWPTGEPTAEQIAAVAPPPGFVCPEGWRCIAPSPEATNNPLRPYLGLFHHLHAGSEGGIWGEIIVMLSGLALVFFTVSGMWVYYQMWRNRKAKGLKKGLFWK
ncbi:hypothetical protein GCM10023208_19090 [Erythrobacter westpacificensis]|uniref:PepSY domain-containing protein n=1 Tax=Erythrobacter westpacificensis TaxID=1055231 RepID=A0ABP9KEQ5_9SPHN